MTDAEIDRLCERICESLDGRILTPDEIRDATGDASRSLGEEGKKKGLTTTLPVALGKLQATGAIHRVPIEGRLDQQRYRYTLWKPNPRSDFRLSTEEIHQELAKRFFKWIGPATLQEFVWFSGLGVGAAKKAIAAVSLIPTHFDESKLILKDQVDEFEGFQVPPQPHYQLVSSLDSLSLLHRDLKSFIETEDLSRSVFYGRDFQKLEGLADLPNHAIFDRGRLIGLWEFDTSTNSIVWVSFIPKNSDLEDAVHRVEALIRDEIGDARSFSLDSPKSRIPTIEALWSMG